MQVKRSLGGANSAVLKASFAPIVDENSRILVLGSLPGEMSLRAGRYYANPRNQFWRLIGAVIGVELAALEYGARLGVLLSRGVGLWDVVESAERSGSLDTAIRAHRPNALAGLAAGLPRLRATAFNGAKSFAIGSRALAGVGCELVRLPSSSPALTTPYERKLERWMELRRFLQP